MDNNSNIGRIVFSKAGRDKNKAFIIIEIFNDEYVYICDGNLKSLEKPKKKKIKHLVFTNTFADEIKELILSGKEINDSMIRKFLQSYDNNKEV